jgi:hypothetical protein
VAVGVTLLVRWALRTAPAPDWPASVDVDRHPESTRVGAVPQQVRVLEWDVLEKAMLASLIAVIFGQVIPDTTSTPLQMTFTVSVIVVANAAVSLWLAGRGRSWATTGRQFVAMVGVNAVITLVYFTLFRRDDVNEGAAVFFLLLLSLIITLYDRYRPLRSAGYPPIGSGAAA